MTTTAIYDLDHTLIGCDSDYEWGQFLARSGLVDGEAYRLRNQSFYDDYLAGILDPRAYLDFVLEPLGQIDPAQLSKLRQQFLQTRIRACLRRKAQDLIARHREAGWQQVVITSTNAFIAEPITEMLDLPNLIAPRPETQSGHLTGKLLDQPCFGPAKPERLRDWAKQSAIDLGETWGYSDSFNDLPLLEFVDHPIAVNPDPTLQSHAKRCGWEILDLST